MNNLINGIIELIKRLDTPDTLYMALNDGSIREYKLSDNSIGIGRIVKDLEEKIYYNKIS